MKNGIRNLCLICIISIIVIIFIFRNDDAIDNKTTSDVNFYSSSSQYSDTNGTLYGYSSNREKALTDEEAESLRGTGYNNTRPNSSAEDIEINAAQVKCKQCGYRSHNGLNSLCDSCQKNRQ